MLDSLGYIVYGGWPVEGMYLINGPEVFITTAESGYSISVDNQGKTFQILRAEGQLGLFEVIYTGTSSHYIDEVPDSEKNYSYRVRWVLQSPLFAPASKEYYTFKNSNIV